VNGWETNVNLSASVSLTPKGVDEVLNRSCKLRVRQRSVLLLLGTPQTLDYIFKKLQIVDHEEITEVINNLSDEGFVEISGGTMPRATAPALGGNIQLLEGIIISEAKFLLVDFCVDSFGKRSQKFVDELDSCKNEKHLQTCLKNICVATEEQSPDRLAVLLKVIAEINATA
jgi:hypothetical protein